MPKRISLSACLALVLVTGLGGCATHASRGQALAANNPDCVKSTGTRIADPNRKCVNVPGSSYTQEDVRRTGEIDLGAALKKMDPRFR